VVAGAATRVWRTRLAACIGGLRHAFEERCLRHRVGGMTRHPVSGAVEQPRLLYGNLLQTRQLPTFRFPRSLSSNLWFPYGNLLIQLGG
jgi:hypothetical protein